MFCALLGQDIRRAFTGPLVLWFVHCDTYWYADKLTGPFKTIE